MTQEELCTQLKSQFGDAVGALSETKGDRFLIPLGAALCIVSYVLHRIYFS